MNEFNIIQKLIFANVQNSVSHEIQKLVERREEYSDEWTTCTASINRIQNCWDFVSQTIFDNDTPEKIMAAACQYRDEELSYETQFVMTELSTQIRFAS